MSAAENAKDLAVIETIAIDDQEPEVAADRPVAIDVTPEADQARVVVVALKDRS